MLGIDGKQQLNLGALIFLGPPLQQDKLCASAMSLVLPVCSAWYEKGESCVAMDDFPQLTSTHAINRLHVCLESSRSETPLCSSVLNSAFYSSCSSVVAFQAAWGCCFVAICSCPGKCSVHLSCLQSPFYFCLQTFLTAWVWSSVCRQAHLLSFLSEIIFLDRGFKNAVQIREVSVYSMREGNVAILQ